MNIIARSRIDQYCREYPNARAALLAWYDHFRKARYDKPADVQQDWGSGAILPDNWVVFNLKGNQYRLVVRFNYFTHSVYIRWFGTHAEYDRINVFDQ